MRPLCDEGGGDEGARDQAELQRAPPPRDAVPVEPVPDVGVLERPPDELGEQHPPQQRGGSRVQADLLGGSHADGGCARGAPRRITRIG